MKLFGRETLRMTVAATVLILSQPTVVQAGSANIEEIAEGLEDFVPDTPEKPLHDLVKEESIQPAKSELVRDEPQVNTVQSGIPKQISENKAEKTAPANSTKKISIPSNWIRHKKGGISIATPANWTIRRDRRSHLQVGIFNREKKTAVMVIVDMKRKPSAKKIASDMKREGMNRTRLPDLVIGSNLLFQNNIFEGENKNIKIYVHSFASKIPNKEGEYITIGLALTNLYYKDYIKTFDQIISSIKAIDNKKEMTGKMKLAEGTSMGQTTSSSTNKVVNDNAATLSSSTLEKLSADIDHDGKTETIAWKKFSTTELGDFYQLLVFDDDGSLLWKGPEEADDTDPLVFYALDIGVSLPQVLVDFDRDGDIELLAPMAQSDVSPTYYRKLRWRGDHFEPLLQSALMLELGSSSRFVWKQAMGVGGTWVSKLSRTKRGEVLAEITQMRDYGGVDMGEVSIVFDTKGARVKRVLRPPKKVGADTVSSPFEGSASENSVAQSPPQKSNTYQAKISDRDHYNSRGVRLENLASVLRQDRANYYNYGGDGGDQSDRYFKSIDNRRAMERIAINPVGISYRTLIDLVVYATPLLKIEVEQSRLNIWVIER